MKTERYLISALVAVFVCTVTIVSVTDVPTVTAQQGKEHAISITKVGTDWKAISATGDTVRARPGDRVVWTAVGTDAYFQFMDDRIFGGYTKMVKAGQKLVLPVGAGARKGVNAYAVFCLAGKQFATGDSPPIIIIE